MIAFSWMRLTHDAIDHVDQMANHAFPLTSTLLTTTPMIPHGHFKTSIFFVLGSIQITPMLFQGLAKLWVQPFQKFFAFLGGHNSFPRRSPVVPWVRQNSNT